MGKTMVAMVFGNIAIYSFGLLWLCCLVYMGKLPINANKILIVGLYPFIPGDLLKIALAAILLPSGWKLLGRTQLPSDNDKQR